jgi:hypothetical protein
MILTKWLYTKKIIISCTIKDSQNSKKFSGGKNNLGGWKKGVVLRLG